MLPWSIWLWEGLASFLCDNKLWAPQADSQATLWRIVYACRPGWATAYLKSQSGQGSKLSTIRFKMEPMQTEKICCPQPRKPGSEKWGGIGPREPTIPLYRLGTWTEAGDSRAHLERRNCLRLSFPSITPELCFSIRERELEYSVLGVWNFYTWGINSGHWSNGDTETDS